jgi:hypothetical protein
MNDKWLNRGIFWILAIAPLWGVFMLGAFFGPYWFVTSFMVYAIIYRPILHIIRLLSLKKIEEKDAWKFFIPFYQTKYIRSLWLG